MEARQPWLPPASSNKILELMSRDSSQRKTKYPAERAGGRLGRSPALVLMVVKQPVCRHAKRKFAGGSLAAWLASEPFRLFFLSGILFSIAGVALWPLAFRGWLDGPPGVSHARTMIQAFGGGFVVGFLGTAGPRMMAAPRLHPAELWLFFALHLANGVAHLRGLTFWGDLCFVALFSGLLLALGIRFFRFRKEMPPPSLLLAVTGIGCGIGGTLLWMNPTFTSTSAMHRLAGLLLYQGFLLGPVLGVGLFLFPRMLGVDFEEPRPGKDVRRATLHAVATAVLLLMSFGLEGAGYPSVGLALRAAAICFALWQLRGFIKATRTPLGTWGNALRFACLPLAVLGLLAAAIHPARHVAYEHLLYAGGFGLLCLITGSRVLFGHSGSLERFSARSWAARILVSAVVLAALTRTTADFLPRVIISHYEYAAASWMAAAFLWCALHARRWFQRPIDS
jgi:uncharacterized protein involved in response to NO